MCRKSTRLLESILILCCASWDVATAQDCQCENTQPFSMVASQNSGLRQSWYLRNLKPVVLQSQFEQMGGDQPFGYSFMEIPFLCNPVLTIVAMPFARSAHPDGSDSSNDSIQLQVRRAGFRWSRPISALSAPAAWHPTAVPGWRTLTLPLSNLPGSVSLLTELTTTRLDVYLQDDTKVRSLTLSGRRCPGPGISRNTCCGDGAVAWTDDAHVFALHSDGNIKRAFYQGGGLAQWIQTAGNSPIVAGSFAALDAETVLLVNDEGQVVKTSPAGSVVIPKTERIHPCSLTVSGQNIFGVRSDNGHVVLIDRDTGVTEIAEPWGQDHRPIPTSLIPIAGGRVAGVTLHRYPWNIWFDGAGKMQWGTIETIGRVSVP